MNYIPLLKLSGHSPVSLILRHAERFAIDNMVNALEIRLTEKGHNDSLLLGRELADLGPFNIYHSPVPRCQETATGIHEGLIESNSQSTISGHLMELGGPYVLGDWMELVEETRKYGSNPFVRKWFDGELMEGLMMPLKEAACLTANILIRQLQNSDASTINISHDWNIMILREYFFNLRHDEIGLPDYLDGIASYIEHNRLHLLYHEEEIVINLPLR